MNNKEISLELLKTQKQHVLVEWYDVKNSELKTSNLIKKDQ